MTQIELHKWEVREKARIAQKVKKKLLSEEDQNFKFFHAMVNHRCKNSSIPHKQLSDGIVLNSPKEINLGATRYFQNFLLENSKC